MNRHPSLMTTLLVLALAGVSRGQVPLTCGFDWSAVKQHYCCPNDYQRKPMPCTAPGKWCGANDYQPKPMPCTKPGKWCGENDYGPKPPPRLCPWCPPWFTCGTMPGSGHAACSGTKCDESTASPKTGQ